MIDKEILIKALAGEHVQFHRTFPALFAELVKITSWLIDPTPLERAYCVVHDIHKYPTCDHCGENRKWVNTKKIFSATCGKKKCQYIHRAQSTRVTKSNQTTEEKDREIQKRKSTLISKYGSTDNFWKHQAEQRKSTMMSRYGVEYTASSPELREKMKNTIREKYGVDNVFCIESVCEQSRQTSLEKYGAEYHQMCDEGKAARQQTCKEKYGASNALASKEIRKKIDDVLISRYGTKILAHINPDKRTATLQEKYGVPNIRQAHINPTSLALLDDPKWLVEQHHTLEKTLVTIADELCVDPKTVGMRLQKYNIAIKRFGTSTGERSLLEFLETLNTTIIPRTRSIIPPYEIDAFLPDAKIAIEYCGLYWHSDIHPRMDRKYHVRKTDMCADHGIRLLTIYEDEWLFKRDAVEQKIRSILHKETATPIHARKCKTLGVSSSDLIPLYESNHIQGPGRGSICYALVHEGTIVAGMSFINHGKGKYELNRYASSVRIRGGFSKLLMAFKRSNRWSTITSYADRRWSVGTMYEQNGFTFDGNTQPSYWYLSPNKLTRIHRSHFRKEKLTTRLSAYDPTLTEFENCDNNGVLRIWDCGLKRYIMKNSNS
jgi:hypothetical protein